MGKDVINFVAHLLDTGSVISIAGQKHESDFS